jgi:hypothetical protein
MSIIDKVLARPNILEKGEIYRQLVEVRKQAYREIGFKEKTLEDYLNESPGHSYYYGDLPNAKEEAIRIFLLGIEDLYIQVGDANKIKEALIKYRQDIRNGQGAYEIAFSCTLSYITLAYSKRVESHLEKFCKTANIQFSAKEEDYDNPNMPYENRTGKTTFTMSLWRPSFDREVLSSLKEPKYYKRYQRVHRD